MQHMKRMRQIYVEDEDWNHFKEFCHRNRSTPSEQIRNLIGSIANDERARIAKRQEQAKAKQPEPSL